MRAAPCQSRAGFLVVTCEGRYRDGAAGNPDAEAIIDFCRNLLREHEPIDGFILDYRSLIYDWGDMIEGTLDIDADDLSFDYVPSVIVAGDRCAKALQSLLLDDYTVLCASTIDEAVAFLERRIEGYDDAEQNRRQ